MHACIHWFVGATWPFFVDPTTAIRLLVFWSVLMGTGLALYISGRKDFLDRMRGRKIGSTLFTIFSFIVIIESLVCGIVTFSFSLWYVEAVGLVFLLSLALCGLSIISGILWLADGSKVCAEIEDNLRGLKQKIDFEEAWTKYSKDLFIKYVEKYPHNPEGVLEWHIHKKMKEGKAREQALKELEEETEKADWFR